MLDHERLDVYQCAIEFLAISVKVMEAIPKGNGALVDHLKRASWSIPLNIAEGCGKIGLVDKKDLRSLSDLEVRSKGKRDRVFSIDQGK